MRPKRRGLEEEEEEEEESKGLYEAFPSGSTLNFPGSAPQQAAVRQVEAAAAVGGRPVVACGRDENLYKDQMGL